MYSDMSTRISAFSSPKRYSARARASSVLPTPVGPRKMNEPTGPLGVLEAGPRAPDGARDRRDRVVLADDAAVERLLHAGELGRLLLLELARAGCRSSGRRCTRCPPRSTVCGPLPLRFVPLALHAPRRGRGAAFSFSRSEAAFSNSCASRYMSFSRTTRSTSLLELLDLGRRRQRHEPGPATRPRRSRRSPCRGAGGR